MIFNLLELD